MLRGTGALTRRCHNCGRTPPRLLQRASTKRHSPSLEGVNRQSIAVINYRREEEGKKKRSGRILLIARGHYEVIISETEVGAGNVPFFDPGSSLAVRHAGLCGYCWSHPTGQAARQREPGSAGRGQHGGGATVCSMQNDTERNGTDLQAACLPRCCDRKRKKRMCGCQVIMQITFSCIF